MTFDDGVLTCRSASPFFEAERDGAKPNTIRVVKTDELLALGRCTRIRVVHADNGPAAVLAPFERDITGIFDITLAIKSMGIRGTYNTFWVCICWNGGKR